MKTVKGETWPKFDDSERVLPTFCISESDLKEIKGWSVGTKYKLVMEVEMTGAHERDDKVHGDFTITKIATLSEAIKKATSSEYSKLYAKARGGELG